MKLNMLVSFLGFVILIQCNQVANKTSEFKSVSQVETGNPVSVMLTSYSTTLIADGKDQTRLRIAVIDSAGKEITSASNTIHIYVKGDGKVVANDGSDFVLQSDTAGYEFAECSLIDGTCHLIYIPGSMPGKVKVEARSGDLWPGRALGERAGRVRAAPAWLWAPEPGPNPPVAAPPC